MTETGIVWLRLPPTRSLHIDLSHHLGHQGYTPSLTVTPDQLKERSKIVLSGFESSHRALSNITSTIDGDVAHGRAMITAYHYLKTDVGIKPFTTMRGYWDMELVRSGDKWLFHKNFVFRTSPLDGYPELYEVAAAAASKKWNLEINASLENATAKDKDKEDGK
jgi:SnoaL-like domain